MVYMLALAGRTAAGLADRPGAMSGGPAPGAAVALILAAALLGYVAWTADRLSSMPPVTVLAAAAGRGGGGERAGGQGGDGPAASRPAETAGRGRPVPLSPRLSACCEIAMGLTMGYMLIMMLS